MERSGERLGLLFFLRPCLLDTKVLQNTSRIFASVCVCVSLSISLYPLEMSKRPTDRDDRTNHGTPVTKHGTPLDRPSWPLTAVYRDEPGRGDALVGAAGLPTLRR